MSAASHPSGGRAGAENELLARLGLSPSASPEDVDQLHLAVSQYLAAAPSSIRGWAHAQASALDEAYLQLTDPVGLQGSALRSPARPPSVVPGGPATPPARRGPVPEAPVAPVAAAPAAQGDENDLDALYASVTPSAHRDMARGGSQPRPAPVAPPARVANVAHVAIGVAPAAGGRSYRKAASIAVVGIVAVAAILFVGINLASAPAAPSASADPAAANASPSTPPIDQAQVAALMQKITADPKDTTSLMTLGDIYYAASDYANAAVFYNKVLLVDPKNVKALLATGAASFNLGDLPSAKGVWNQVVAIDPKNVEAHYDLGFLYMNQASPDWAGLQHEWSLVIALDPGSAVAQTVQQHLDSLVAASMIPAPSAGASPAAAPAASGSAAPAASAGPSASVAPSAPTGSVVNETALNLAFGTSRLSAPAGTPFTIHFDNQDTGVPHDIEIRDSAGNTVFKGEMVTGPAQVDYAVPALAAGLYTFACPVHPNMTGTLTVGG
jgi:cytochrome c-type biogenesis protein CcmH/NrfG/plastocyanin